MFLGKVGELRPPSHRPVGVEDFADHPGRNQAGHPGQIDAGLGLPDPLEHAAGAGPEREDMAGPAEVGRHGVRLERDVNRLGPVGRRNPGGDAESSFGIDTHGEGGTHLLGVVLNHLGQPELIAPVGGERETDQAPAVHRHEVDQIGGNQLRRADQVALVLPLFVVGHDDTAAVPKVLDRLLDRSESHLGTIPPRVPRAATYFPIRSPSTWTRSVRRRVPNVVWSSVCGIRET